MRRSFQSSLLGASLLVWVSACADILLTENLAVAGFVDMSWENDAAYGLPSPEAFHERHYAASGTVKLSSGEVIPYILTGDAFSLEAESGQLNLGPHIYTWDAQGVKWNVAGEFHVESGSAIETATNFLPREGNLINMSGSEEFPYVLEHDLSGLEIRVHADKLEVFIDDSYQPSQIQPDRNLEIVATGTITLNALGGLDMGTGTVIISTDSGNIILNDGSTSMPTADITVAVGGINLNTDDDSSGSITLTDPGTNSGNVGIDTIDSAGNISVSDIGSTVTVHAMTAEHGLAEGINLNANAQILVGSEIVVLAEDAASGEDIGIIADLSNLRNVFVGEGFIIEPGQITLSPTRVAMDTSIDNAGNVELKATNIGEITVSDGDVDLNVHRFEPDANGVLQVVDAWSQTEPERALAWLVQHPNWREFESISYDGETFPAHPQLGMLMEDLGIEAAINAFKRLDEDTDGDGLPILLELALGLNLAEHEAPAWKQNIEELPSGEIMACLVFDRPAYYPGLKYILEYSHDLVTWERDDDLTDSVVQGNHGDTETVCMYYRQPLEDAPVYLRLAVELVPMTSMVQGLRGTHELIIVEDIQRPYGDGYVTISSSRLVVGDNEQVSELTGLELTQESIENGSLEGAEFITTFNTVTTQFEPLPTP